MLTFLVNFQFGGLTPLPFKLTNIALHAANGTLLFGLLRQLLYAPAAAIAITQSRLSPPLVAALVATTWTALAIHVAAVLHVVQRMELLAQTFVLLALWSYVIGRQRMLRGERARAYILMGLIFLPATGVLAKETAVLVPGYALLIEVYIFRFAAADSIRRRWLVMGYITMAACAAIAAWILLPRYLDAASWQWRSFNMFERLMTEARVVWQYVSWTLAPDMTSMGLYHDNIRISRGFTDPPITAIAVIAWAFVIGALVWLIRRPSLVGLGLSWFLCAHALTATILPLELVFEHRNYFASIGLLIAAIPLLLRISMHGARVVAGSVILILLAQLTITGVRAFEWSDPLRHAHAEAARNSESPRAVYELARVFFALSERDISSPLYKLAVENFERAARLPDSSAMPEHALLLIAALSGAEIQDRWWEMLQTKLQSRPIDAQSGGAIENLVRCQLVGECKFETSRLVRTLALAANREPQNGEVLGAYSDLAYQRLGDAGLAEELSRDALALTPKSLVRRFHYARILAYVGKYDAALAQISAMEQLDRIGRMRSKTAELRALVADLRNREGSKKDPDPASAG